MELARNIVGLGATFAPIPGLNLAFETLNFIWENVQKASTNKEALKNLVLSTAEILVAIDRALSRSGTFNEHIRSLLRSLEKELDEFLEFAKKHVSKSLFRILIKNVDVEGRIEQFQSRMQNLLVAFNIAALGSIDAQLGKLLQGQQATAAQDLVSPNDQKRSPAEHGVQDFKAVRVHASFSEPCTITLVENHPVLTCLYFPTVGLETYGLGQAGTTVNRRDDECFDIVGHRYRSTWTLKWMEISTYALTMVFPNAKAAAAWFAWLRTYAGSQGSGDVAAAPASCDVWVRKVYNSWMRKTPSRIERSPYGTHWFPVHGGVLHSASVYRTHFTYIHNGPLPFMRAYRSGDTLVMERRSRADEEEPVAARRYRFATEELARGWYKAWEDCVLSSPSGGGNASEPVRAAYTMRGRVKLRLLEGMPVLASSLVENERLHDWGVQKRNASITRTARGFEVATLTASWSWVQSGKQVTVHASVASQPDLCDRLELVFRSGGAARVWFAYLEDPGLGESNMEPPRAEEVALKKTRVCWLQDTEKSVDTRTAMSSAWHAVFDAYTQVTVDRTRIVASTATGAEHRFAREGRTLCMERRRGETGEVVEEEYAFGAEGDAVVWAERWRGHVVRTTGA